LKNPEHWIESLCPVETGADLRMFFGVMVLIDKAGSETISERVKGRLDPQIDPQTLVL